MKEVKQNLDLKTGEYKNLVQYYSNYTVYLKNRTFTLTNRDGGYEVIANSSVPILINRHIIQEYYTNKARISLIELGKDLLNDINYLESLDKDDMEQFVNALMVFTNAEFDEEDLGEINRLGAVSISSTENREAKVELLEQRLKAGDTQVYYTRLLTSLHQILAIPMATDTGTVTSGDTGKSKLVGQGYTMAGIRAEGDETMFEACDRQCLSNILAICRETADSKIKSLKSSEIDSKFSRDTSDNLLVKTQGLLNLYDCDIPREIANSVINLFNDPNSVTKMQEKIFGAQKSKRGSSLEEPEKNEEGNEDLGGDNQNPTQKVEEQNNNIRRTQEIDDQQK